MRPSDENDVIAALKSTVPEPCRRISAADIQAWAAESQSPTNGGARRHTKTWALAGAICTVALIAGGAAYLLQQNNTGHATSAVSSTPSAPNGGTTPPVSTSASTAPRVTQSSERSRSIAPIRPIPTGALVTSQQISTIFGAAFTATGNPFPRPYLSAPFPQCGGADGLPGGASPDTAIGQGFKNANQNDPVELGVSVLQFAGDEARSTVDSVKHLARTCADAKNVAANFAGSDAALVYMRGSEPIVGTPGMYEAIVQLRHVVVWITTSAQTESIRQAAAVKTLAGDAIDQACRVHSC